MPLSKKLITSRSPLNTKLRGVELARTLPGGTVVALFGTYGSGKSTFVRGMAPGLGVQQKRIASPSFVLIQSFPAHNKRKGIK